MKAWHVQDTQGEYQEIVYAIKRSHAIQSSEAIGWNDFIDVRAKRAPYADDLQDKPREKVIAMLENGWWFECPCLKGSHINIDSVEDINEVVGDDGKLICVCYKFKV